jgi:phage tail sheath protein FI
VRLIRSLDPRNWFRRQRNGLAQQIEAEIRLALAPHAGDPNDETLWALARGRAAEVLHVYWLDGRLAGDTADDAYFARCDRTTMTQDDIDAGRLIVLVGFAPLRPAEFEIVRIQLGG